jgi:hypothetical protein
MKSAKSEQVSTPSHYAMEYNRHDTLAHTLSHQCGHRCAVANFHVTSLPHIITNKINDHYLQNLVNALWFLGLHFLTSC